MSRSYFLTSASAVAHVSSHAQHTRVAKKCTRRDVSRSYFRIRVSFNAVPLVHLIPRIPQLVSRVCVVCMHANDTNILSKSQVNYTWYGPVVILGQLVGLVVSGAAISDIDPPWRSFRISFAPFSPDIKLKLEYLRLFHNFII